MDYMADLLARLNKGESVEDIASQLTKDINAANAQFQKDKAEREAKEKAKVENVREERKAIVATLLDATADLLESYNVDKDIIDEVDNISADEVLDLLDKSINYIQKVMALENEFKASLKNAPDLPATRFTTSSNKDPIEDFLNKFVR